MYSLKINKTRQVILFIYIIAILVTSLNSLLKLYSLNYYPDFSFYMEFTSKLFDNTLTNNYTIYPNGFNFFGYSGLDGLGNFHRSLHFEPIKYLYAIIFIIFNSPYAIFLLRSVLYFSPLLFIAFYFPINDRLDKYFIIILSTMLLVFPSSLPSVAHDLRPFSLITPVLLLLIFSIYFNRSHFEIFIFFNALFLIREEALLFSVIALLVYSVKHGINKKNTTFITILIINWLFWIIIYYLYFNWADYDFAIGLLSNYFSIIINPVINVFLLILLILTIFLMSSLLIQKLTGYNILKHVGFIYLLFFVSPLFYIVGAEYHNIIRTPIPSLKLLTHQVIFDPRYNLLFILTVPFLFIIFSSIKKTMLRYGFIVLMSIGVIICLIIGINRYNVNLIEERYNQCKPIYSFKNKVSSIQPKILTDKNTSQAFYNFESIYVIGRHYEKSKNEYQIDSDYLKNLLMDQYDYIVVSNKNLLKSLPFISEKNNKNIKYIFRNDSFSIIKLNY